MLPPPSWLALALLGQWAYSNAEHRPAPPRAVQGPATKPFTPRADAVAQKLTPPPHAPDPGSQGRSPNTGPDPNQGRAAAGPTSPQSVFEWRRLASSPPLDAWGYLGTDGVFYYTELHRVPESVPVTLQPYLPAQATTYPVYCPPGGT